MQKKIIALAIASAISAPAFADNANITFYGIVDASYDIINTGNGTTTANGAIAVSGVSKNVVSSNVSRFGFKGAEDLGNGLSVIWQIEQQIDIDAAAKNTFASRNTFAGLSNKDFGTVLLGIHDTPYKLATRKFDVFSDSIADNRSLVGGVTNASAAASFDGRQTNVLAYVSPEFAGLSVAAALVNLTESNTTSGPAVSQGQGANSATSLNATYKNHEAIEGVKIDAGLGYESHTLNTNAQAAGTLAPNGKGTSESAFKLGAGVEVGDLYVSGVYESTKDNLAAGSTDLYSHTAIYGAAKYKLGADAVKFAYTKLGAGKIAGGGASQYSLGYDFTLSKRTKLYAIYSAISNNAGANFGFSQSSAASTSSAGFGTSPTVLSLGVKHTF